MRCYINKISSLEEKASAQVAINLCQGDGFKEVAMCLEKPTYGFINLYRPRNRTFFQSDPEIIAIWAKVKEDDRLCRPFMRSLYDDRENYYTEKVRRWDAAVDEQCQRQTERIPLPDRLRQKIHPWMKRVALELLSYSRRQEVVFGISRYFLMNIFTRGDWKDAARLDEKKLAQRFLEDERLTVFQRYRIACVYCLLAHIRQLWERLTQEQKRFCIGDGERARSEETHSLVILWSRYMDSNHCESIIWPENHLRNAISEAISYGNVAALMVCRKEFQEVILQKTVIDWALESLQKWQIMGEEEENLMQMEKEPFVKRKLVLHQSNGYQSQTALSILDFNLPSYYTKLMFFFLSLMDEEGQLTFFKKAFQSEDHASVLECFLDWPHQEDFLPAINRLWGIIPEYKYKVCLIALASKYSGNANNDYDYRSLLGTLWEETPEEYKPYVFLRRTGYFTYDDAKKLLPLLLERFPFQEKDENLFKLFFHDQPQEKRRAMMLSEEGENMCSLLVQKEKWSFLNWFLEECLSKKKIPDFKKRFIQSVCGVQLCLDTLVGNREKLVEDLLIWSLTSDAEKTQYKNELISRISSCRACESLLCKGKFAEVERVINFCLSSDENKERFKVRFAQYACSTLLEGYTRDSWSEECVWEQMDTIIAWSVDTDEKIIDFKKNLFLCNGIRIHYILKYRGKVERFRQWFGLTPEEIKLKPQI